MIKIYKSLILVITFISALFPIMVNGQTTDESTLGNSNQQAVIEDVEGLRAEFKEYTQDPETKKVKYEMILNSQIDSDRVKITWSLKGSSSYADKTQAVKNITVLKGKSYAISIELIPTGKGVTELVGKAEAYAINGSYIATVRKNFATNSESEVLPLTDAYKSSKSASTIKNVLITSVVLVLIAMIGYFAYKRFKVWLNRP